MEEMTLKRAIGLIVSQGGRLLLLEAIDMLKEIAQAADNNLTKEELDEFQREAIERVNTADSKAQQ